MAGCSCSAEVSTYKHSLELEPQRRTDQLVASCQDSARQTLEAMSSIPGRPAAMAPFDSLMSEGWREEEIASSGRKVVGTLCNFVPEELILAAGAIPLRLEQAYSPAVEASERVLPLELCPEVKSLMGAHLLQLPFMKQTDLLVMPTACDGKKKLIRALGEHREVWMLELPQVRDSPRALRMWSGEITALARQLEKLTGTKIRRRPLRAAIDLLNRRTALVRQLNSMRWEQPGLLTGRDMFLVMHATFIADPGWWVERAAALVAELKGRPASDDEPLRILITGSPILFPDYKLLRLIEEGGAVVVADEMCSGTQRLCNPTVVDETSVGGMIRAAAEKALLPCTCPVFVADDLRIDRIIELARRSGASGVIHHTLRLCQVFDMGTPRVEAALRARDLPLLNIHDEFSAESAGALKNRVDAFIEMLQL